MLPRTNNQQGNSELLAIQQSSTLLMEASLHPLMLSHTKVVEMLNQLKHLQMIYQTSQISSQTFLNFTIRRHMIQNAKEQQSALFLSCQIFMKVAQSKEIPTLQRLRKLLSQIEKIHLHSFGFKLVTNSTQRDLLTLDSGIQL